MDYRKIYADFIESRKHRAHPDGEYLERHHVIPKSLGGTDAPENIVLLTPGDHYFAHLCLAKIHGGSQWGAVWCMVKMTISKRRRRASQAYGKRHLVSVARREFARAKSEKLTGVQYRDRQKKHTIHNEDGRSLTGPVADLVDKTGVSFASISRLVNGKQVYTMNGWYLCADALKEARMNHSELGKRAVANVAGKNSKKVRCVETGVIYESISEATRSTGANVKNAFKPGRKTAGGCHWEFV